MGVGTLLTVCTVVTAMLAALAAVAKVSVWLWQGLRKLVRLADALMGDGEPSGRPGVLARLDAIEGTTVNTHSAVAELQACFPDVLARLAALEAQMKPNGGATLRDAVDRIPPNDVIATAA